VKLIAINCLSRQRKCNRDLPVRQTGAEEWRGTKSRFGRLGPAGDRGPVVNLTTVDKHNGDGTGRSTDRSPLLAH